MLAFHAHFTPLMLPKFYPIFFLTTLAIQQLRALEDEFHLVKTTSPYYGRECRKLQCNPDSLMGPRGTDKILK